MTSAFAQGRLPAGVTNAMLSCLCDSAEAEPPLAADFHISSAFLTYQRHLTVFFLNVFIDQLHGRVSLNNKQH